MSEEQAREALAKNIQQVQGRIAAAAARAGRDLATIQLVAVSKTVEPARVLAAYRLGLHLFGENRVEEAETKIPAVADEVARLGGVQPVWHMIGHLQSRKAARAVELFDLIQAVDSAKLAQRLDRLAASAGKKAPILLELNISGEASKHGFPLPLEGQLGEQAPPFLAEVATLLALPGLEVRGLMTMAPQVASPEQARPYFRRLREWRDLLASPFPECGRWELSMGMTDDFEVAIEEGATIVRLGRAIFASPQMNAEEHR